MKLHLDPLPAMRENAEKAINDHFNRLAYEAGQRDAEHAAKRAAAQARVKPTEGIEQCKSCGEVIAVDLPGTPYELRDHLHACSQWFEEAAAIEGVTPDDLARAILAKPDEAAARGNARRRAIVAVRSAGSTAVIETVLRSLGI